MKDYEEENEEETFESFDKIILDKKQKSPKKTSNLVFCKQVALFESDGYPQEGVNPSSWQYVSTKNKDGKFNDRRWFYYPKALKTRTHFEIDRRLKEPNIRFYKKNSSPTWKEDVIFATFPSESELEEYINSL